MNGYRAKRIEEMILNAGKVDINTCKEMQQDLKSVQAEIVVNGMVRGLKSSDPKIQIVIDLLENWDFVLRKDSSAAAAYQVFVYNLCRHVVEPKLGKELTDLYMGKGFHVHLVPTHELLGHTLSSVVRMFKNKDSKWISSNRIAIEVVEKSILSSYEILCKSLDAIQKSSDSLKMKESLESVLKKIEENKTEVCMYVLFEIEPELNP